MKKIVVFIMSLMSFNAFAQGFSCEGENISPSLTKFHISSALSQKW